MWHLSWSQRKTEDQENELERLKQRLRQLTESSKSSLAQCNALSDEKAVMQNLLGQMAQQVQDRDETIRSLQKTLDTVEASRDDLETRLLDAQASLTRLQGDFRIGNELFEEAQLQNEIIMQSREADHMRTEELEATMRQNAESLINCIEYCRFLEEQLFASRRRENTFAEMDFSPTLRSNLTTATAREDAVQANELEDSSYAPVMQKDVRSAFRSVLSAPAKHTARFHNQSEGLQPSPLTRKQLRVAESENLVEVRCVPPEELLSCTDLCVVLFFVFVYFSCVLDCRSLIRLVNLNCFVW